MKVSINHGWQNWMTIYLPTDTRQENVNSTLSHNISLEYALLMVRTCRTSELWQLLEEGEPSHSIVFYACIRKRSANQFKYATVSFSTSPSIIHRIIRIPWSVTLWMCSTWVADWLQRVRRLCPPISGQFPEQSLKILLTCNLAHEAGFSTGHRRRCYHSTMSHY